jgi:hypothetical protein
LTVAANAARGDDTFQLKEAVVDWISKDPESQKVLDRRDRSSRGLYNDATALLLCPIDYNWDDPE